MNIAINGFGRIGRQTFRHLEARGQPVLAVNDLAEADMLAHLLRYDSTYGPFPGQLGTRGDALQVNGREVRVFSQADPAALPWAELGVEIVIEATGRFTDGRLAREHLQAGAKKVIITAPAKNYDFSVILGHNEQAYDPAQHHIITNASCTTNSVVLPLKVLDEAFGVEQLMMTTVHAYTSSQKLLDAPHRDWRRARSAAQNIVPTTTGVAHAVRQTLPKFGDHNFVAQSLRVPVAAGSVSDLTLLLAHEVSAAQVNDAFRAAAEQMPGLLRYSEEHLVSSDIVGDTHSAIIDGLLTQAQGRLVKVMSWYDNEWGYASRVAELAQLLTRTPSLSPNPA